MALIKSSKTSAIVKGIEKAETAGMSKTYDVALFIQVELDNAGLKIVRKPSKDGLREFGKAMEEVARVLTTPLPETFLFHCDCGFSINLFGSEINPSVGVSCLSNTGDCHEAMQVDSRDRQALRIYQGQEDHFILGNPEGEASNDEIDARTAKALKEFGKVIPGYDGQGE